MPHLLQPLSYAYDALEPWIDRETMMIHHDKHHAAYLEKLNGALASLPDLQGLSAEDLLKNLETLEVDPKTKTILRNHGGGHVNHSFFWTIMGPEKKIDSELQKDIENTWGSVDAFKAEFLKTSVGHFGSGWTWLVRDQQQALQLYSLPNQDSPLTRGHTPVLALDLWEHAYYLKYKNLRADYVAAWWNVVTVL